MKRKILVVEDEFLIAAGIMEDLRVLGYEPIIPHCASYDEAIHALNMEVPDLVLVDLRLQGTKDGAELAAFLQTQYIPYILLTSNFNPRLLDSEAKLKPAGLLTKPFHINNLYATIEFALRQAASDLKEQVILPGAPKKEVLLKEAILFVTADQNYTHLQLEDRQITVRMTLKEVHNLLGYKSFQQVHRSFLVGLAHVSGFKAGFVFVKDHKVPIGRAFKMELLNRLQVES